MELILGIIIFVVINVLISRDKIKTGVFDAKLNKEEALIRSWMNTYTDPVLEQKLRAYIKDPIRYESICEEVGNAFQEMESWRNISPKLILNDDQVAGLKGSSRSIQDRVLGDRDIALDIMLANRGKVSIYAANFGYNADVSSGTTQLMHQWFDYVEWIKNTLRKQGVIISPMYKPMLFRDAYVLCGSRAGTKGNGFGDTFIAFNRDLIEKRSPAVPEPYYKQQTIQEADEKNETLG